MDTRFLPRIQLPSPTIRDFGHQNRAENIAFVHSIYYKKEDTPQPPTSPDERNEISCDWAYFYRPLNYSEREIRLIQLEPGTEYSELCCRLLYVQLGAQDSPQFECLSYCWGKQGARSAIRLQPDQTIQNFSARRFPVRKILAKALVNLRRRDVPRTIWVDAICIDQTNVTERASQVTLMKEIFAQAKAVQIWLGRDFEIEESKGDIEGALQVLQDLSCRFQDDTGIDPSLLVSRNLPLEAEQLAQLESYDLHVDRGKVLYPCDPSHRALWALQSFYGRPYFRRVWVLQEVAVARAAYVFCGTRSVEWGKVLLGALCYAFKATRYLTGPLRHEALGGGGYLPDLWLWIAQHHRRKPLSIVDLLLRSVEFQSTDPRDRIYALLGLASETEDTNLLPMSHRPSYIKPKEEVFQDFTLDVIKKQRSLKILSAVNFQHLPYRSPAWLPHFDQAVPVVRLLSYSGLYKASNGTFASFPPGIFDRNILPTEGVRVDVVRSMNRNKWGHSTPFGVSSNFTIWYWGSEDAITETWNTLVAPLRTYPTGEKLLDCFVLTLTCVGFASGKAQFPEHPLGTILPSCQRPCLFEDFAAYWKQSEPQMESIPSEDRERFIALSTSGNATWFGMTAGKACEDRIFFITSKGYFGLCPRATELGDLVVALYGGSVLYILRPVSPHLASTSIPLSTGTGYLFIGECYVHGLMDGSVVNKDIHPDLQSEWFYLY
jgi:hypothetical protein